MFFLKYKRIGVLVLGLTLTSVYASDNNRSNINNDIEENSTNNIEWPKNGILFKTSDMTLDESGLNKDYSSVIITFNGNTMGGAVGKDFNNIITKEIYERERYKESSTAKTNKKHNQSVFVASFSIGDEEDEYVCTGMSLEEFKDTYGKKFDTQSDSNHPPQRWAISVSGTGKDMVDWLNIGKKLPFITECKWKFWPII